MFMATLLNRLLVSVAICAAPPYAQSEEGTIGWRYAVWRRNTPIMQLANDPVTACSDITLAGGLWGTGRIEPAIAGGRWAGNVYNCFVRGRGIPLMPGAIVFLECDRGYIPQFPGVCRKVAQQQAPAAPGCSASSPGFTVGNPVVLASGTKIQNEVELNGNQWNTLQISRLYRAARTPSPAATAGFIWSFSFERQLAVSLAAIGGPPLSVTLYHGDGVSTEFQKRGNSYAPTDGGADLLTPDSADYSKWMLKEAAGVIVQFAKFGGQLLQASTTTVRGQTTRYSYDENGKLSLISDTAGRTLKVSWHDKYAIASIASPELQLLYTYEHFGTTDEESKTGVSRLIKVDAATPDGIAISTKQYHYGDEWKNWFALTGITDENNVRFASYSYDSDGRVSRTEHAGGADQYDIAYPSESSRTVTDPLGSKRTVLLQKVGGQSRIIQFSQPGGAGCGPAAARYAYNSNGTLQSQTDFNGAKTCFVYDQERRLETGRFEGLRATASCPVANTSPSAGQRKVATKWHPDWAIPVAVAGPLKLTHIIYNGQPDLDGKALECAAGVVLPNGLPIAVPCKKIEIPTNDANGGTGFNAAPAGTARVMHYSYNQDGQVLTETALGRAGSAGDTITYTYYADANNSHNSGDLATVTLPNGETTEYLEYTASGRATKIREANGQITTQEYSPQGWLLRKAIFSGTADEQQTRYSYDLVGQLIRTDLPDGTAIIYRYDDAHRLTDISDNSGNTTHYELDQAGHRIREDVRDAAGRLRRQTTRTFDGLGRLKQTSEGAPQ